MKYIFSIFLLVQFSACATISKCEDALDMKTMVTCESKNLDIVEQQMKNDVKVISKKLAEFNDMATSKGFIKTQKEFLIFAHRQCEQETLLWGRGSMRRLSPITCLQYLYTQRIEYFKISYKYTMSID